MSANPIPSGRPPDSSQQCKRDVVSHTLTERESRIMRSRVSIYSAITLAVIVAAISGHFLSQNSLAAIRFAEDPLPSKGGSLLICGGGKTPDEIRDRFLALAGGENAKILVIPTAHAAADSDRADAIYLAPWRDRGAKSVAMLHTRSRATANDPAFLKALTEATGVWISGGKQSMLASAYGGTEVEKQLKSLLDRGGVVAGTSAGAAIMTRVMIESGRSTAVEGLGFDLFPNAVVDQHFLKRKRMDRLMGLLKKHPDLLGFGIDEGTALLVQGDRLSVLGDSYVVACLPESEGRAAKTEFLKRGDATDFASLKGPEPRIVTAIDLGEAPE